MILTFIKTPLKSFTFESPKIKEWAETRCIGKTLNLFAGKVRLNIDEYRIDIQKTYKPDTVSDAFDYIKSCNLLFDTVLLDPPYSYRKAMEYYQGCYTSRFKLIADEIYKRKIKRVVSFGYHTTFMGQKRNYELKELCIMGHSGAQHATIAIVEELI